MVHLHLDTVTDSRTTLYKSCLVNLADDGINLCDDLGSACNHQCNNNRFLLDLLVVLSREAAGHHRKRSRDAAADK